MNNDAMYKDDSVNVRGDNFMLHGPNGLFRDGRVERIIVNAVPNPVGLDLPAFPTLVENPIFAALTGIDDHSGAFATDPCEPGPAPGAIETCHMMFPLGRVGFSSNSIDIDRILATNDRSDTRDFQLLGSIQGTTGFNQLSANMGTTEADVLNREVTFQMFSMGRAYHRWIARTKWTGDPTNPNQSAGYREFYGFDNLIRTGWRDALSNELCPSLDSDVKDFEGQCVSSANGANIYEYLTAMERSIQHRAMQVGLWPTQFTVVMRPEIWWELSLVWPLLEFSFGAIRAASMLNVAGSSQIVTNLSGSDSSNATTAMRSTMTISINGNSYPVVIDDAIEVTAGDNPVSTIYFIPLTVQGGMTVTYWEYLDYRATGDALTNSLSNKVRFWTDDGRYMWTIDERLFCFRVHSKIEPRLIMRTPFLAGRVDNVCASPIQLPTNPFDPTHTGGYIHNPAPVQ